MDDVDYFIIFIDVRNDIAGEVFRILVHVPYYVFYRYTYWLLQLCQVFFFIVYLGERELEMS